VASAPSVGGSVTPTSRQEGAYSSRMDDARGMTTAVGKAADVTKRVNGGRKGPTRKDYREKKNNELTEPENMAVSRCSFSCRTRSVGVDFG
jgi:hypothetical protein